MKQPQITYEELLARVEAGERLYANAGEIVQRCMTCERVRYTQHFVLVEQDTTLRFKCHECLFGLQGGNRDGRRGGVEESHT